MNRFFTMVGGLIASRNLIRCSCRRGMLPHIKLPATSPPQRHLSTTFRRSVKSQNISKSPETPQQLPPKKPPPPGSSPISNHGLILGTIIGTCTTIYIVHTYYCQPFVYQSSPSSIRILEWFDRNMVLSARNLHEGRYYTLLTSTLTHYNFLHLGVNMLALWGFGRTIISIYGAPAFAALWLGSAVSGGMLQIYFWRRDRNERIDKAIGASSAVLGMFSVMACAMPSVTVDFIFIPMPIWAAAGLMAGLSIAALKEGWVPSLGHAAHLGGMAFGVAWWGLMLRKGRIVKYRGL